MYNKLSDSDECRRYCPGGTGSAREALRVPTCFLPPEICMGWGGRAKSGDHWRWWLGHQQNLVSVQMEGIGSVRRLSFPKSQKQFSHLSNGNNDVDLQAREDERSLGSTEQEHYLTRSGALQMCRARVSQGLSVHFCLVILLGVCRASRMCDLMSFNSLEMLSSMILNCCFWPTFLVPSLWNSNHTYTAAPFTVTPVSLAFCCWCVFHLVSLYFMLGIFFF